VSSRIDQECSKYGHTGEMMETALFTHTRKRRKREERKREGRRGKNEK